MAARGFSATLAAQDMVSWDIVLGLMVMAFALPFIFLSSLIKATRQRAHDELAREQKQVAQDADDAGKTAHSGTGLLALGVGEILHAHVK